MIDLSLEVGAVCLQIDVKSISGLRGGSRHADHGTGLLIRHTKSEHN